MKQDLYVLARDKEYFCKNRKGRPIFTPLLSQAHVIEWRLLPVWIEWLERLGHDVRAVTAPEER